MSLAVTGAAHLDVDSVAEQLAIIRAIAFGLWIMALRIKYADSAKAGALADGVVVGSALVKLMIEGDAKALCLQQAKAG